MELEFQKERLEGLERCVKHIYMRKVGAYKREGTCKVGKLLD